MMRALIVLCLLVAATSAELSSSTLSKAKDGCDFGVPEEGEFPWEKIPVDKTVEEAKKVALGEGAEFLTATRLTGIVGGEHIAIHAKVGEKCCSQKVARPAGTQFEHKFEASEEDLCCYKSCPEWMTA